MELAYLNHLLQQRRQLRAKNVKNQSFPIYFGEQRFRQEDNNLN